MIATIAKTALKIIGIIGIGILIYLTACKPIKLYPKRIHYKTVKKFPVSKAQKELHFGVEKFSNEYGKDISIKSIRCIDSVTKSNKITIVLNMMSSIAIVSDTLENQFTIKTIRAQGDNFPKNDSLSFARTLMNNIESGDYVTQVELINRLTNRTFTSINTISPDAKRISGAFFLSTVIPDSTRIDYFLPNTNCPTVTLGTYAFSSYPKFQAKVCIAAECNLGGTVIGCPITTLYPIINPFGELAILPNSPETEREMPPILRENYCTQAFRYRWATGLKSVKINRSPILIEVTGYLGRESPAGGKFTIIDNCSSSPVQLDPPDN